jgi:hypothetical protein
LINVILRHMFFNSFCDCSNNTGFLIECNRMNAAFHYPSTINNST